jgi:tetratricopeptide (TPR) repeat protein
MRLATVLAAAFVLLPVFAQDHSAHSSAPPPVALEAGLSDLHFKVNTNDAEAQRYFDQGMRYVYAFNHEHAIASFRRATDIDPNLAMGYWGMALALGPNINMDVDPAREKQAYDLAQVALSHLEHASGKEQALIRTLTRRYSNDPAADLKKLAADYANGMREVHAQYPDDPDIATLFAESVMNLNPWRFWSRDGKAAEGTNEFVGVLESVLKAHPHHLGANHYYIHAVEASRDAGRALPSAERLETLAPAAGHLVHMPAHIYQRTGNYVAAAKANVAGADADRAFIKKYGGENMYSLMYYNHNLDFGATSYAMAGQYQEARALADEVSASAATIAKTLPPIEPFTTDTMKVLLRFNKWFDILRTPA